MTEEFSDSEEDEDNPNDFGLCFRIGWEDQGTVNCAKSHLTVLQPVHFQRALISSVANKPQSGNLEELTINEWKLSLWVKVLYEGETYIGKVINIQNNVSKNHLGSIQIIFMIWGRKTVVHFTKLSIRLM